MKVTAITKQVKNNGRYSIFVDGKYGFSFSELGLVNSGLKIGIELTAGDIERFKKESAEDKLYNRALGYIARRGRSEWEMKTYLERKTANHEEIKKILNKLTSYGFLDDKKFALSWVESRKLLKPTSNKKLKLELRQKRIPDPIISEVLNSFDPDEMGAIKELIFKKRRQTRYQDDLKLMQFLVRQGFSYGDVKRALEEVSDNR